jgi:hypothetical protein
VPVPLSSDAFSKWGASSQDQKQHNMEVKDATRRLEEVIIPAFASYLDKDYDSGGVGGGGDGNFFLFPFFSLFFFFFFFFISIFSLIKSLSDFCLETVAFF